MHSDAFRPTQPRTGQTVEWCFADRPKYLPHSTNTFHLLMFASPHLASPHLTSPHLTPCHHPHCGKKGAKKPGHWTGRNPWHTTPWYHTHHTMVPHTPHTHHTTTPRKLRLKTCQWLFNRCARNFKQILCTQRMSDKESLVTHLMLLCFYEKLW